MRRPNTRRVLRQWRISVRPPLEHRRAWRSIRRALDTSAIDTGASAFLTFWPTEFSQIRGQFRHINFAEGQRGNEFLMSSTSLWAPMGRTSSRTTRTMDMSSTYFRATAAIALGVSLVVLGQPSAA